MKVSKSVASVSRLFSRLPATACSVVALAAVAPAAHAAVTVSPVSNLAVPATTAGIYINVVSGITGTTSSTSGWDINPWGGSTSGYIYAGTGGGIVSSTLSPVASLAAGAVVDVNATYLASPGAATFGAGAGQWTLNATNYFGFRFIGDDTLLHYGYGTLIVGATATTRTIGNLWYDSDANTGIRVAAVPEASTTAMMLAGVAALAGASLLRRKLAAKV